METAKQLRKLRTLYAWGAAAWTACLLLGAVAGGSTTRQTVVLLGLLAVFLTLVLWTTWCLWEAGATASGRARGAHTGAVRAAHAGGVGAVRPGVRAARAQRSDGPAGCARRDRVGEG
ncbi:hypothetical protein [Streptomyces sp. NPDC003299]